MVVVTSNNNNNNKFRSVLNKSQSIIKKYNINNHYNKRLTHPPLLPFLVFYNVTSIPTVVVLCMYYGGVPTMDLRK